MRTRELSPAFMAQNLHPELIGRQEPQQTKAAHVHMCLAVLENGLRVALVVSEKGHDAEVPFDCANSSMSSVVVPVHARCVVAVVGGMWDQDW